METSGGYFVVVPTSVTPIQPNPAPRRRYSARRRWPVLAVACVAVTGIASVIVHVRAGAASRPVVDPRPVAMPTTILGNPRRSDAAEQTYEQQMQPVVHRIFGSSPGTVARYSTLLAINLIAGRGPVAGRPAGDVRMAAHQHQTFGDITCANMLYKKSVLTDVDVCWYSTPAFGASLLVIDKAESMADVAAALDAAVPGMRDG